MLVFDAGETHGCVRPMAPGKKPESMAGPVPNDLHRLLLVAAIDQHLCVFEKLHLLRRFFRPAGKTFTMRLSDVGKDADGRPDDLLQPPHLTRAGDTSLENG